MQSITVYPHVGEDGILRLQIPIGVKNADLRVTINFQLPDANGAPKSPEELGWPPGFIEQTYGCLKDFPEIEDESDVKAPTIDEIEAIAQSNGWPPGFFRQTAGSWVGEQLERPPQGEYEVRDELL